jgi:hypothetical protein
MAPYAKLKPQTNEKTERNDEIVQYKLANPKATVREIGSLFGGISGARVSKILRRAGIKYERYGI